jgi:hypothetical protein
MSGLTTPLNRPALDCVDIGFLNDTALDELPLPSRAGATPGSAAST